MKKFFSLAMIFVMLFTITVPAFAAGNGTITIENATIDQVYTPYKIFDATYSGTGKVSYTISTANQFYTALFGNDGNTDNAFFSKTATTVPGVYTISKKDVDDSALIDYLLKLIKGGSYESAKPAVTAGSDEVKFEGLDFGYYVITSSLGTAVTITSTIPDATVIDKNQKPSNLQKKIWEDVNKNNVVDEGELKSSNTASIGDSVHYQISMTATNYDGANQIQYYSIYDIEGEAIYADYKSIKVFVGKEELTKGWYLGGESNSPLGNWSTDTTTINDAEWYLVKTGDDKFHITIPWMTNHTLELNTTSPGYTLTFDNTSESKSKSKYASPSEIKVTFKSQLEANATIDQPEENNDKNYNEAYGSWFRNGNELGRTDSSKVTTNTYGLGLHKKDMENQSISLAGAKFRLYSDAACKEPVYVIPTNVQGVYMVDDYNKTVSGNPNTARKAYESQLSAYLGSLTQDNRVESPVNGKIMIIGLAAGDYWLKEYEAPAGYNLPADPVRYTLGTGSSSFEVFHKDGVVAEGNDVSQDHIRLEYKLTTQTVLNSSGTVLPSTGGTGTVLIITIGSILAIGAVIFLVTNKKMSVYTD
ncbi:LPXTG cell wall anchor domain-containing protein [Bacillus sp. AGMB 02131]|uniref:LPXTG cell wall anchor domain-containing protein n=1 Tax=Peribacillus faecalis TaxID=2772559 RepID=A0A927CZI8_9BACI|nr:SpaA isopeptide-forming pilin-related protein [Peribacillus faecalis]MBD3109512.1 LPXTG cell wall anchor domain-containing protein [Peribacillus faecalis]